MSDYWKSLPRKYCDICKCWFADNKASIEFHEKGKNHQENVKKRINEIQKKGLKDYKAKKKLDDQMEKIEKAALAAFKKDMEQDPELAAKYSSNLPKLEVKVTEDHAVKHDVKLVPKKNTSGATRSRNSKDNVKAEKVWYEAKSDEGHVYYWNTLTSESRWEPPEEGYVSLEQQNSTCEKAEVTDVSNKESKVPEDLGNIIGPQMKPDPYGNWVPVEEKSEQPIDWQLPEKPDSITEVTIPLTKDTTSFKMKEKTVGHLSEEFGPVESTFKKRKNLGNAKRNMRQRLDEDG